jgi:hypothetical protein
VSTAAARVTRLLEATRRAVAPGAARAALVRRLTQTTGLSRPNIEAALDECLELEPSQGELEALLASVQPAPRAHVILPSNVFVAAHRALALALAAAPRVRVKPSRREPAFTEALHAQAPELFELATELAVAPGDHVFAYGSDTTLDGLRGALPAGAVLHAHGSGFGVALVELEGASAPGAAAAALGIARDTARFDQRGCLSPRFVFVRGSSQAAADFAEQLATALVELERELPPGRLEPGERAEARWWVECAACLGPVWEAGAGRVSLRDPAVARVEGESVEGESVAALEVPPAGRHLEVVPIARIEPALDHLEPWLTCVGCSSVLEPLLGPRLPRARVTAFGHMQRPPFDGPVDRRPDPRGEVVGSPPS